MKNITDELKEMLEKLSKAMRDMSEVVEVSQKYPQNKDIFGLLLNKRIEDGLINNLYNASEEQLKRMKNDFGWRYYKEDKMFSHNPDEKIQNQIDGLILNKKREKKLKRINNI